MPRHDVNNLLSTRLFAEHIVDSAERSLYEANQPLAQALLLEHGINPDLPISHRFPVTYVVDGYEVTITPNDTPGDYDVDVAVAVVKRGELIGKERD